MTNFLNDLIFNCEKINNNLSLNTVCFTGHRSQKLPWRFNEEDVRYKLTRIEVKKEIEKAILKGKSQFISGMALGFDMMCAEIVLELKKKYPNICLICAVPCKNQDAKWNKHQQERYKRILNQADKIRCIYDHYTQNCMQERNRYMVNASSLVIALFNGKNGGTQKTIEYAEKQGKEIVIIRPRETFDLTEQDIDDLANEFYEQTEKENYKMLLRAIYRVK